MADEFLAGENPGGENFEWQGTTLCVSTRLRHAF